LPEVTVTRTRAVLLDMGGVLLDMGNAAGMPQGKADWRGREAMAQTLRAAGGRIEAEALESKLFEPWRREYARRYELGREADWSPHLRTLRRELRVRMRDLTLLRVWFEPYAEQLAPMPGARETLAALAARGLALALVSNVPLPGALYEKALRRARLLALLPVRRFSYDAGSRKPSPAMLRSALGELGAVPECAVMVGDRRSSDVAAGRAAGVRTVWLKSADGGGPKADVEIAALGDLVAAID
jgi:HAD superfamily hydrolase (TIGR01509 family)